MTCFLFAALGVVAAMIINSHEDMANFSTFVILPMSFLSGTFFLPDRLPLGVAYLIKALPLTHTSYALRSLAQGQGLLSVSLAVLVGYAVILFIAAVVVVQKVR